MSFYSDDVVTRVREANDIVDIVSGYVRLNKRGDRYFGLCPFHNEKTPSFSVTRDKQLFYCYGCHAGGDVFRFVQKYENLTFPEALSSLAARAGITLPERKQSEEEKRLSDHKGRLFKINKDAGVYFYRLLRSDRGQSAYAYFKNRGLSDEVMSRFGLGYSDIYSNDLYTYLKNKGYNDDEIRDGGLGKVDEARGGRDRFFGRAMFPIMDTNSKVIAFGGRVMGEGQPKYLNSPETMIFNKSRTLYGLNIAKQSRRKGLILCEGYMDVISLHQAGFDNAVATLGTALTPQHAAVISRYSKEIYLSYDSDGAGKKAALRGIPILRNADISCKIISLEPYKDPDELIKALGADEYEQRIADAKNSFMFQIEMLEDEYDLADPDGKSRFARACARELMAFSEEIERNNYVSAISQKYNMDENALKELIRHTAAAGFQNKTDLVQNNFNRRRQDIRSSRGDLRSQRLLLQILSRNPQYYAQISPYITTDDFEDGVYRKVAGEVFDSITSTGEVVDASIISLFSEEDDIDAATRILCDEEEGMPDNDDIKGYEAIIREVVLKMIQERIKRHADELDYSDAAGFQNLIDEKKQFEDMKKTLHFVLTRREHG